MYHRVMLCLVLFIVSAYGQVSNQTKLVYTEQGAIRGYRSANYDVFEFFNIPYATAPSGVDKFKAPLPPPSWNGTFDAINRGILCPQARDAQTPPDAIMQEDCLLVNVYVPDTQDADLPVLVNVHGGGYHLGNGAGESPTALVDSKKIIAVTFNYRLGIHGFLCLGTEVAPGNAGMKDQVALLRWVRDNIKQFGGDPEDVTIAGCSAGGASVDTLLLSNMTRGLYHKVISQSGCSMSSFGFVFDPLQNAKDHAEFLNFNNPENVTALGEFYASLSLQNLTQHLFVNSKDSYFFFVPCVERDLGQEVFLEESPISILRSGNFPHPPMLYGFAAHEGLLRIPQFSEWIQAMNTNFSDFLTRDLVFETEQQRQQVATEIREFYFGVGALNESHVLSYIDYMSDVMITQSILRTLPYYLSAGNNQIYFYEYALLHNNSVPIPFLNTTGAPHCEQHGVTLGYLNFENPSEELISTANLMREMYINFITTGNPNSPNLDIPIWPSVSRNHYPYLQIDSNVTVVTDGHPISWDLANRTRFWDNVYELYGTRVPIPPTFSASPHVAVSNQLWIVTCVLVFVLRFK